MVIMTVTSDHKGTFAGETGKSRQLDGISGRMNASRPMEGGATFTLGHRVQRLCWQASWLLLAAWTPSFLWRWRGAVLRAFGAKVHKTAIVRGSARIWWPGNLTMGAIFRKSLKPVPVWSVHSTRWLWLQRLSKFWKTRIARNAWVRLVPDLCGPTTPGHASLSRQLRPIRAFNRKKAAPLRAARRSGPFLLPDCQGFRRGLTGLAGLPT